LPQFSFPLHALCTKQILTVKRRFEIIRKPFFSLLIRSGYALAEMLFFVRLTWIPAFAGMTKKTVSKQRHSRVCPETRPEAKQDVPERKTVFSNF